MKARINDFIKRSEVRKIVNEEFEKKRDAFYKDTAVQLTAIVFYTLAVNEGWGKKRLQRLMDEITGTSEDMNGVGFAGKFNAMDLVSLVRDKYEIDLEKEITVKNKEINE